MERDENIGRTTRETGTGASQATVRAREELETRTHTAKSSAASSVRRLASALHSLEGDLQGDDDERLARYTREAARGLDRTSDYIQRSEVSEILTDGEDFARRHAVAFLAGSFAAGALLGRFLRSSRPEPDWTETEGRGALGGQTLYEEDFYRDAAERPSAEDPIRDPHFHDDPMRERPVGEHRPEEEL